MLIECIPNFSDGRNPEIIKEITDCIESVIGVQLLGVEMGEAANRTVVTFVGHPDAVCEAAFLAVQKAAQRIDMQQHQGTHPRMGATDVCPLVPISGISMAQTNDYAHRLAERIGCALNFPVYCYEFSATRTDFRKLEQIRTGEYESLKKRVQNSDFQPDYGSWENYKTAGATVVGARNFLIAYNFNINSDSKEIAHEMARDIRESGRIIKKNHQSVRVQGFCKSVKAIGWKLEDYPCAQVSTNITNLHISPVYHVYEALKKSAKKYKVKVTGAELIGLVPLEVMLETADFYLEKNNLDTQVSEGEKVRIAIDYLGLNDLKPFDPYQKIIEYKMQ